MSRSAFSLLPLRFGAAAVALCATLGSIACGGVQAAGDGQDDRATETGGAIPDAVAVLEREAERRPQQPEVWVRLAQARLDAGEPAARAASDAARALAVDPGFVEAHVVVARAAARSGDSRAWLGAYTALGPVERDALIGESSVGIVSDGLERALRDARPMASDLLTRAAPILGADAVPALTGEVERYLFQLYYAADFALAREVLALAEAALPGNLAWRRHRVALAFESRSADAETELRALSEGRAERARALAVDFTARGTHRAARGAWAHAAELSAGDEAASAYFAAARHARALALEADAEALVTRALEVAVDRGAAVRQALASTARDGSRSAESLRRVSAYVDGLRCDDVGVEVVASVEDELTRALLENFEDGDRATLALERARARAQECESPVFLRAAGMQLLSAMRYREAGEALTPAFEADPGDAAVAERLISVREWAGDAPGAAEVARRFGDAFLAANPAGETTDRGALEALAALRAGTSPEVSAARVDFLRRIAERAPTVRSWAFAWAAELERQGLVDDRRALLQRYVDGNGGSIEARYYVAHWLSVQAADKQEAIDAARAVATDADAVGVPAPILVRGGWSAAESAWMLVWELAQRAPESPADAVDAVGGVAALRAATEATPWRSVWDDRLIGGFLPAPARAELLQRVIEEGAPTANVWSALGTARFQEGDTSAAVVAWVAAARANPDGVPALLADIERAGALAHALAVLDAADLRDDGTARSARTRLDLMAALARQPAGPWESTLRRVALAEAARTCLARGCAASSIDVGELELHGLPAAALEVREAALQGGDPRTEADALDLALLGLAVGRDDTFLRPLVDRVALADDANLLRRARDRFTDAGRTDLAAQLARAEMQLRQAASPGSAGVLLDAATWFDQYADEAEHAIFVDEVLRAPAELLLDPGGDDVSAWRFSPSRRDDASLLLAFAAEMQRSRGQHAQAYADAMRALRAAPAVPGLVTLATDTLLAWRGSTIGVADVDAIAAETAGGIGAIEEIARALRGGGRPDLARHMLSSALDLAPSDPALLVELAGVCAEAGDAACAERAAESAIGLIPSGRSAAAYLDEVRAVVGTLEARGLFAQRDRLLELLAARDGSDLAEVALATAEAEAGQTDIAARRIARAVGRGSTAATLIRALHDGGWVEDSLRLLERAAPRLGLEEHADLRYPVGESMVARQGSRAYTDLLLEVFRQREDFWLRSWMAEELVHAGLAAEAVAMLEPLAGAQTLDQSLLTIAHRLDRGDVDEAWRLSREVLLRFDRSPLRMELVRTWGGAARAQELLARLNEAPAVAPDLRATLEALAGDPGPLLDALADPGALSDADQLAFALEALRLLGLEAEAGALLAERPAAAATAAIVRPATPDEAIAALRTQLAELEILSATDVLEATLAACHELGAADEALALVVARFGALVGRSGPERASRVLAVAARLAPSASRAGALAEAAAGLDVLGRSHLVAHLHRAALHDEAAALLTDLPRRDGAQVALDDVTRALIFVLAGRSSDALAFLDALEPPSRRRNAADALAARIDPQLDPSLRLELAERSGATDGPAATAFATIAALHRRGDEPDAQAVARRWLAARDGHPAAVAALGAALRDEGLAPAFAPLLSEAMEASRGSAAGWREVAFAAAARGDTREARTALERGAELAPDVGAYWMEAAALLSDADAWELADIAWRGAAEALPESAGAEAGRAVARVRDGAVLDGIALLGAAEVRGALEPVWLARAAAALAEAGATDEAAALLDRLRDEVVPLREAAPTRRIEPVLNAWAQHDAPAALSWIRTRAPSWLDAPEISGAETVIATLFEGAAAPEAAANVYERALALEQRDPTLLNNLAYVLAVADREHDRALALAERSMALEGDALGSTVDTWAWALYRAGRLDEALAAARASLHLEAARAPAGAWSQIREVLAEHLDAIEAALAARPAQPEAAVGNDGERRRRAARRRGGNDGT